MVTSRHFIRHLVRYSLLAILAWSVFPFLFFLTNYYYHLSYPISFKKPPTKLVMVKKTNDADCWSQISGRCHFPVRCPQQFQLRFYYVILYCVS